MLAKLEVIGHHMAGFKYQAYFIADTSQKLSLILQAEELILSQENGIDRFGKEVMAPFRALVLAIPYPRQ